MATIKLVCDISDRKATFNYHYELDKKVPDGLDAIAEGLMQKGFGETLRDKFSTFATVKGPDGKEADATPEDKDTHTRDALGRLADGTYQFGGRGPSMSPEDKAMKEALKVHGVKWSKGLTVDDAVTLYTKELAKAQDKEYTKDMDAKVVAGMKQTAIYKTTLANEKAKGKAPAAIGVTL